MTDEQINQLLIRQERMALLIGRMWMLLHDGFRGESTPDVIKDIDDTIDDLFYKS